MSRCVAEARSLLRHCQGHPDYLAVRLLFLLSLLRTQSIREAKKEATSLKLDMKRRGRMQDEFGKDEDLGGLLQEMLSADYRADNRDQLAARIEAFFVNEYR